MKLSYVIVSYNRRESLLKTLGILETHTPLSRSAWEVWVVDNASTDGSAQAVRTSFPSARIIQRDRNEGVWARSHAFARAAGDYIVLLDDDSYPVGNAVVDSVDHLERHPTCGAVVGRVVLPDGSLEACAIPTVMISCAVVLRKSVIDRVGGFRREFFRKAGEYDFSYRIWQAGFSVDRFEDIVYRHDKVLSGRSSHQAHRLDLRNNLILIDRFIPANMRPVMRRDAVQRYSAMARHAGQGRAVTQALIEAAGWRVREALTGRETLDTATFERIFAFQSQQQRVAAWAHEHNIRSVALADFSKNLLGAWRAGVNNGLDVRAVVDDHPAFAGLSYEGAPVVGRDQLRSLDVQGVIVSNINPAQVASRTEAVRQVFHGPVLTLWEPAFLTHVAEDRRAA
jgi:GT2 family glycosyltransferase